MKEVRKQAIFKEGHSAKDPATVETQVQQSWTGFTFLAKWKNGSRASVLGME
jgi:hypothetical protein